MRVPHGARIVGNVAGNRTNPQMFRYPLQLIQKATDTPDNPGAELAAVIADAKGMPVLTLNIGGTAGDDNKRAQFVADSLNNPLAAAVAECEKQQAIAGARRDVHGAEFWRRLAGSCRKAAGMI